MKKSLISVLTVLLVLALTLSIVAACNPNETNTFTVTFKNGEETISTVTVEEGQTLTEQQIPQAPTAPQGQKFDGWFVGQTKVEAGYKPTTSVTATAKFVDDTVTPNTFTVTFKNGEETISTVTVEEGQTLTEQQIPQAPTAPQGQKFDGWFVGQTKVEAGYKPTTSVTATAKFSTITVKYTITFDLGSYDGSDPVPAPVEVDENTEYYPKAPNVTFAGKTFIGWKLSDSTDGAIFDEETPVTVTSNITLVAQWQGIERGNYVYTHFYTGNGSNVLYLDGNGGGEILRKSDTWQLRNDNLHI